MRHLNKKKLKIGYDKGRKLLRSMAASLILYEKITTTNSRAKIVRRQVEKFITRGKQSDLAAKRYLFSRLPLNAARKILEVLGPKYKERKGGFTRLIRMNKSKDGTDMARIEFV